MKNTIKTIDVNCLEWFDKVNGNSYFAGSVTVNYGMKDARTYAIPYQYGYGDQYKHEAFEVLENAGEITREKYPNGSKQPIWQWCENNNVIARYTKQENCKKRELTSLNK